MPHEPSRNKPSRADIFAFLTGQTIAVLSTVSPDGLPDAAPVYFVSDDDGTITFLSSANSKKNQNIANRNRIVLTCTDLETKETVQIRGTATVDAAAAAITIALSRLATKLNAEDHFHTVWPLLKHPDQQTVAVVVRPAEIRMRRYHDGGVDETTLTFNGT